jgi:hypothetical protein
MKCKGVGNMDDRRYLITYRTKNKFDFDWLETEEELREFIECNEIEKDDIIDALEIIAYKEVEL